MTSTIANKIYGHLDQQRLQSEDQKSKSIQKKLRETNDLLYIDKTVIREIDSGLKTLAMTYIHKEKTYDTVCVLQSG